MEVAIMAVIAGSIAWVIFFIVNNKEEKNI